MAKIQGTNVAAPLAPFTTDDQFPTHDAFYGKGGQREVATIAERDAIPSARLTEGCTCYVAADEKTYRWKNNTWVDDTPQAGSDGKSAYQLYCDNVPEGEEPMSESDWLDSLHGEDGQSGDDGKSAYQVYLDTVPEGETPMTKAQWLASLKGPQGDQGNTVIIENEQTYQLFGTTGQSDEGAMTQKAVTNLVEGVSASISELAEDVEDMKGKFDNFSAENLHNLTLSFNNSYLAYNSTNLQLKANHVYRFRVSMETTNTADIPFYLRKVYNDNNNSTAIRDRDTNQQLTISAGQTSAEVVFVPTVETHQFLAAWNRNNANLTKTISAEIDELFSLEDLLSGIKQESESVKQDTDEIKETLNRFSIEPFRTFSFSSGGTTAYYATSLGLKVGRTYKISVSIGSAHTRDIRFYLRQVATTDQPNQRIADKDTGAFLDIPLGALSSNVVYFTPNPDKNYQYLALWCVDNVAFTGTVNVVIEEVLSLENYIDNVKDIAEDANMDVFVSQSEMIQGLCINANENNTQYAQYGETFVSSENYFVTGFVNIKGANRLIVKTAYCPATYGGKGICGCVLYDSSKQPLTGYGFFITGQGSNTGTTTFEIEVPDDAVYIRNTTWFKTDAGITAFFDKGYAVNAALEEKLNDEESKPDVVQRNAEAIEAIYAAKKCTKPTINYSNPNHMRNFCLAHITDIHCDTTRYENFRKFVDSVDGINAAVNTGDLTIDGSEAQFNTIVNVDGTKDVMLCVGNHDKNADSATTVIPNATVYTRMKQTTPTSGLYYYKDFTENEPVKNTLAYKVRVIVLNQYDADGVSGTAINAYTTYSQAQIDWFINTLQNAASNGYAVMVCMHTSDRNMGRAKNDGKFYDRMYDVSAAAGNGPDPIIEDIINVFRHGGTLNKSYTWSSIGTVSVNVTFSTTGTFVAYVTGHLHRDVIAYSKNYPDQLYLGGNCGNCYATQAGRPYGTEMSALPRQVGEKSEDCFNVYGINLEEKTVRVVRVGASINDHMERVDYAIYDFEPSTSSGE